MNENETKRVPREFWAELYHQTGLVGGLYDTKPTKGYEIIKVREVFDEPVDPYAELKKAHKEGKVIQCANKGFDNWDDCVKPFWYDTLQYRIKSEPKYRPWKPEEVPVGAIVRSKSLPDTKMLILWSGHQNFDMATIATRKGDSDIGFDKALNLLFADYQVSLDHGKTWLPCGVLEK